MKSTDSQEFRTLAEATTMLTLRGMQNSAQNTNQVSGRLLGFVRVVVGGHVCDLAVQAMPLDSDSRNERVAGGFFVHDNELGILVDESASAAQVQAQIEQGTAEAVRHLSRKYLS
jgi:hypothetical protein